LSLTKKGKQMRNRNFKFITFLLFILCSLLFISSVFAHRVNIFAYVENDTVYTESYFSDGKTVKNGEVEVYDSSGNKVLEGKTDKNGLFNFKMPKKDNLKIVINASMGHKGSYTISKDEFPDVAEEKKSKISKPQDFKTKEVSHVDLDQIRKIVNTSLDKKLIPLVKELKKQKKKISFTEIVGGIGYTFGIFGIIFYFVSKRKR